MLGSFYVEGSTLKGGLRLSILARIGDPGYSHHLLPQGSRPVPAAPPGSAIPPARAFPARPLMRGPALTSNPARSGHPARSAFPTGPAIPALPLILISGGAWPGLAIPSGAASHPGPFFLICRTSTSVCQYLRGP